MTSRHKYTTTIFRFVVENKRCYCYIICIILRGSRVVRVRVRPYHVNERMVNLYIYVYSCNSIICGRGLFFYLNHVRYVNATRRRRRPWCTVEDSHVAFRVISPSTGKNHTGRSKCRVTTYSNSGYCIPLWSYFQYLCGSMRFRSPYISSTLRARDPRAHMITR